MLSDSHSVLQVSRGTAGHTLEGAWQRCRARFMRLTSKGPLKFYRHDLLKEADNAYRVLSAPPERPLHQSVLTRNLKPRSTANKPPIKSSIRTGSILKHHPLPVAGREVKNVTAQAQAKIEDQFCMEVLCRLEGDLLRFTCRRELLQLSLKAGIHGFRANMLIAQIIESVRQHDLYEPTDEEKNSVIHKYQSPPKWKLALVLATGCILIDALIVVVALKIF